ncbi:hypothetical protein DFH07DRAFT_936746 [Mycena maculata]|uniref:Uncharacterized protein n=1 Tax=Mycena maculata TaxID=230809 RepID=A0AAD7K289_9AGAR|nr:hypothetical protein DFH07DRAFT_936746 [Mycena maculata]
MELLTKQAEMFSDPRPRVGRTAVALCITLIGLNLRGGERSGGEIEPHPVRAAYLLEAADQFYPEVESMASLTRNIERQKGYMAVVGPNIVLRDLGPEQEVQRQRCVRELRSPPLHLLVSRDANEAAFLQCVHGVQSPDRNAAVYWLIRASRNCQSILHSVLLSETRVRGGAPSGSLLTMESTQKKCAGTAMEPTRLTVSEAESSWSLENVQECTNQDSAKKRIAGRGMHHLPPRRTSADLSAHGGGPVFNYYGVREQRLFVGSFNRGAFAVAPRNVYLKLMSNEVIRNLGNGGVREEFKGVRG